MVRTIDGVLSTVNVHVFTNKMNVNKEKISVLFLRKRTIWRSSGGPEVHCSTLMDLHKINHSMAAAWNYKKDSRNKKKMEQLEWSYL